MRNKQTKRARHMATILPADKQRFIEELIDLLKIPTISADSKYNDDIKKGASWVQNALSKAGCTETEIFPTQGHPIVYGERLIDPNLPTRRSPLNPLRKPV